MNMRLRFSTIATAILLASCGSVTRPTVTQLILGDPPFFLVAHPLRFSTDDRRHSIVVPIGFVTDLASIPKALWWWQSPHEGTMAPAILHDFLYWEQSCTKDEADAVMYLAMSELSVKGIDAVYLGIRTAIAKRAWDRNAEARAKGETRFFTPEFTIQLMQGNADPKATLTSVQADAAKNSGLYRPRLPNPTVKQACVAAYTDFQKRAKRPMDPSDA
jgi:hypothetical protein